MFTMTEVIKLNTLATCSADTPPIYTSLSSLTLLLGQYTAILQLIKRGIMAIKLLVTAKTLPDFVFLFKTTKAIVTGQPKLGEAKL